MALTLVKGNMIEDGTVTDTNFTNTTITSSDMALDPRNASNLSSGDVPAAQLGNVPTTDLTPIKNDLAMVGFKIAANGSLSQYNLLDQIVDDFQTNSLLAAAYTRHTVTATGTTSWTIPTGVTSVDYLVVAGGGGGGGSNSWQCAGGGAGGYRTGTLEVIAGTNHTITVGAGGAGGIYNTDQGRGQNGDNSVFSTITSSGGGGGGGGQTAGLSGSWLLRGKDGGSGGGGSATDQGNPPAPNATSPVPGGLGNSGNYSPIEGYPGQDGGNAGAKSGGGGGAGGTGTNAGAGANPGGPGVANDISGSSVTYATGGTGRGSVVGTANTGNGGDGRDGTSGQAGGSGIVILRWKASSSTNAYYDTTNKQFTGVMEAQGGVKTTVGSYTVHSFLGTDKFVTGTAGNVDYLVVAGGGGGGGSNSWQAGAGGAGGVRTGTSFAVASGTQAVTIGLGGQGGGVRPSSQSANWYETNGPGQGVDGGNSVFSTISATGGGGGGAAHSVSGASYNIAGRPGGSGGGAGARPSGSGGGGPGGSGNAGSYTPVEGYAGQNSGPNGNEAAGGGGAGGLAITPFSYPPSGNAGGAGISNSYRTGVNQTYGVGGWAYFSSGGPGDKGDQANTGGGGTSADGGVGHYGGTGIVVLRYTGSLGTINNMTLVPNTAFTAEAAPTKGDIVLTYSDQVGTAVINTNITAEFSADDGSTWTAMTLTSQGTVGDGSQTLLSAHDVALTSTSGTSMKYRVKTLVQSASLVTRVHAVSLGWS